MLTQKQEQFTLNLFQGMTQRDAWKQAGYSTNYAIEVLDVNASRLADKTNVKLRLAELRNQAASPLVMTERERKERLSEVARSKHKAPVQAREVVQAIAELNKMEHVYETGGVRDVNVVFIIGKGYRDAIDGPSSIIDIDSDTS